MKGACSISVKLGATSEDKRGENKIKRRKKE
jgi:hypothetical protein